VEAPALYIAGIRIAGGIGRHVLDGLLYHQTGSQMEEHYTASSPSVFVHSLIRV
jgi:hypothetical protein